MMVRGELEKSGGWVGTGGSNFHYCLFRAPSNLITAISPLSPRAARSNITRMMNLNNLPVHSFRLSTMESDKSPDVQRSIFNAQRSLISKPKTMMGENFEVPATGLGSFSLPKEVAIKSERIFFIDNQQNT